MAISAQNSTGPSAPPPLSNLQDPSKLSYTPLSHSPSHHPQTQALPASCTICHSALSTPRADGSIENPSYLPCTHIFGSHCIKRWLEGSSHQNCPNCRRKMRYTGCGHVVIPKTLPESRYGEGESGEDAEDVKVVKVEDMPSLCLLCRESKEMEEVVRRAERRVLAEERALGELSVLPGLFGGLYKGSGGTSVEERTEEAMERWRGEMESLRDGLRGRMEGKSEW